MASLLGILIKYFIKLDFSKSSFLLPTYINLIFFFLYDIIFLSINENLTEKVCLIKPP